MLNRIEPQPVRDLAARFENEVGGSIAEAKTDLSLAEGISSDNFTALHKSLAIAYVEAWNYHWQDLDTKHSTATEFAFRLNTTVENWEDADQASDVLRNGGPGR
jgi:hypothetical protein